MYLKTQTNLELSEISWITWIPLVSLLVEVFVSSIGIIPVPSFYGPEILDQKVRRTNLTLTKFNFFLFQIRSLVMSICSWWSWIVGFLIIKFYPLAESSFGMHSVMLFFAVTCGFCGLFTLLVLPETKGRNMEDIAKSINNKNQKEDKL